MIWASIIILVVLFDQITKKIVENTMAVFESIPLFPNVFHLTHIKNDGASWGMFSGGRWVFVALTMAIVLGAIIWLLKTKPNSKVLLWGVSLILGGAIGNLIDRIVYGQVTDFFDFCLINFPVFNIADIGITIGTVLLCVYLFFFAEDSKGGGRVR